ncbi:MAG: SigE family RNA polymerase sigma factor [Acidimicrobiia bacterium]
MMTGVESDPRPVPAGDARPEDAPDRDAVLGALFRARYESLVGLARLLLDDRGQAEEVVQEAFARAYDRWGRIRNRDDALPYVRRAVVNLARGGLRRRVTARRHRAEPPPDEASAEAEAVRAEGERHVVEAVRSLPRRQRECVVLRFYLDSSTAETAAALGVSEGSVKTHVHRALGALARELKERA